VNVGRLPSLTPLLALGGVLGEDVQGMREGIEWGNYCGAAEGLEKGNQAELPPSLCSLA